MSQSQFNSASVFLMIILYKKRMTHTHPNSNNLFRLATHHHVIPAFIQVLPKKAQVSDKPPAASIFSHVNTSHIFLVKPIVYQSGAVGLEVNSSVGIVKVGVFNNVPQASDLHPGVYFGKF